jgi:hypothetical protein
MPKYAAAPFKEPTKKKTRMADLWCPYCGEWVKFKLGEYGYKRCPVCTISTADFYVRTANHLWEV